MRAALAGGGPPDAVDVAAVLDELAQVRAESAERWQAIGRLAPAAKGLRGRAHDAERLLAEVVAALAGPIDDDARATLRARLTARP